MTRPRLLYLGFAFPPGVQALHPDLNPAGHLFETNLVAALRPFFEIRTVGMLPLRAPAPVPGADPASGVAHDLVLEDLPPAHVRRRLALAQLERRFRQWRAAGWQPDAVLAYNLTPVYNAFIRRLRSQGVRARRVLLLLDSSQLGRRPSLGRRLRRLLKPLAVADEAMLGEFDACVGLSRDAERYFRPGGRPYLWMPGACRPERAPAGAAEPAGGEAADPAAPIRFGYFGAIAEHAGIFELADAFLRTSLPATLRVCGYGRGSARLAELARRDPRIEFAGLLPSPDDCLAFGRTCDVLVNPRPASHGNENNFPSKIFDYALCGRAILTARLSGVDEVIGEDGFYFDPEDYAASLGARLVELAGTPRAELRRRGAATRERVCAEYTWERQGARIAAFILGA
jgi:glycosyltransferase involved in cell wall biosynthesis